MKVGRSLRCMASTVRSGPQSTTPPYRDALLDECQQKYGSPAVWKACCGVFDYLNLAAVSRPEHVSAPSLNSNKYTRSSTGKPSACMAVYLPTYERWTKFVFFPEHRKFPTKEVSAVSFTFGAQYMTLMLLKISCGQTRMRLKTGP